MSEPTIMNNHSKEYCIELWEVDLPLVWEDDLLLDV